MLLNTEIQDQYFLASKKRLEFAADRLRLEYIKIHQNKVNNNLATTNFIFQIKKSWSLTLELIFSQLFYELEQKHLIKGILLT